MLNLKLNSLLGIQVKSRDGAPDAERTAKVQVPVTCEKVQSGEKMQKYCSQAAKSFSLLPKLNPSVPEMLEETKPNIYETKLDASKYESDV